MKKKITFLTVLSHLLPAITVIVTHREQKGKITASEIIQALMPAIQELADDVEN